MMHSMPDAENILCGNWTLQLTVETYKGTDNLTMAVPNNLFSLLGN